MDDDRYQQLATALNAAARRLLHRARDADRELGLSGPRLATLSVLVSEGRLTLAALARAERVAPPTMSRLVDALEHDGLVVREPNPEDRRSIFVSATARGKRLLHRGHHQRVERLAGQLQGLPGDDIEALERAVVLLQGLEGGAP